MSDKDELLKLIRGDDVPQVLNIFGIPLTSEMLSDPEILVGLIKMIVRYEIIEERISNRKELFGGKP